MIFFCLHKGDSVHPQTRFPGGFYQEKTSNLRIFFPLWVNAQMSVKIFQLPFPDVDLLFVFYLRHHLTSINFRYAFYFLPYKSHLRVIKSYKNLRSSLFFPEKGTKSISDSTKQTITVKFLKFFHKSKYGKNRKLTTHHVILFIENLFSLLYLQQPEI